MFFRSKWLCKCARIILSVIESRGSVSLFFIITARMEMFYEESSVGPSRGCSDSSSKTGAESVGSLHENSHDTLKSFCFLDIVRNSDRMYQMKWNLKRYCYLILVVVGTSSICSALILILQCLFMDKKQHVTCTIIEETQGQPHGFPLNWDSDGMKWERRGGSFDSCCSFF